MAPGGKKVKAKDKNGKTVLKHKVKRAKSPDGAEDQTTTESLTPGSPYLIVQEPALVSEAIASELDKPSPEASDSEKSRASPQSRIETWNDFLVNEKQPEEAPVSNEVISEQITKAEDKPLQPEQENTRLWESLSEEKTPVAPVPLDPRASFSPAPDLIPLPSPSQTEAQYWSGPSPDQYYPYYSAPTGSYVSPVPCAPSASGSYYSPYASPVVPYVAPVPYSSYGSQYGPQYGPQYGSPYSPYASPIPKVSSPLAHSHYPYISPVMSPTATPTPPPPPPAAPAPAVPLAPVQSPAPSTSQNYTSGLHSPVMSSSGVVPPYGSYPDGHYMRRSFTLGDPTAYASYQALMANGGLPNENGVMSPSEKDSEHIELLQRIQSTLPDINRLLDGYRNTHSKLSAREAEMKHFGNQHEQALMHKDFYIEALQSQMKKTANESAEECAKLKNVINELRLELGNLQEKHSDLESGLSTHQKSNEELQKSIEELQKTNEELSKSKTELEAEVEKLNTTLKETEEKHAKELEELKAEHEKALAAQKQELTELFEEIKAEDEKAASEALAAREKELLAEHDSHKGEWEKEKTALQESLEAQIKDLETTKTELASKITELESKEKEVEGHLAKLNEEVASKLTELETKEKELQETRTKNAEELDALLKGHADELTSLRGNNEGALVVVAKELDNKIAHLEATYTAKEMHWNADRAAFERMLSEKDAKLASSEREKEKLEGAGVVKEQQMQRAVDEMRNTIDHLDRDCDRLRKTLHSLGEATDLKSTKGDQFFLDCFNQLTSMIYDLAKEHFDYLPIDPPKDILAKIPSEIPPFLDNTPASRELRCAYVQHIISKTLTYRVFQPFLFTLGRRYDKADTFFQMLSMDIRRKSVRREAFWRQQTLKAAYTASDAKQAINVAAAVIVDEIVDHIKHFTDPKHLDSLLIAVRKVVKLAAETWRHARVERELVIADFPASGDEFASNDGWEEYGIVEPASSSIARHVVLRTFPRIIREAAHEDFDSGERTDLCIYAPGVLIFSDSSIIMARLQELAKKSNDTLTEARGPISPPRTPKGEKVQSPNERLVAFHHPPSVPLTGPHPAPLNSRVKGLFRKG
ncbi:hypothetical protein N7495_002922 [Penicillium taxi]|uniref:uncharacterized protein n=1 Tax=Penicillium taxi TaxID=168475 RepID=UPI0025456605|nr:uncharacterized protein N7495_002922 [Penicillium taxi]KAJ5902394.1 hypothetical protein N7495_002922 [Penicillium taxi]